MYDTEGDRRRTLRSHSKHTVRETVPDDILEIHRWLRVRSRLGVESDPDFPLQVVYRRSPSDLTLKRVVLRVHGTYVDGQLSARGDDAEYVHPFVNIRSITGYLLSLLYCFFFSCFSFPFSFSSLRSLSATVPFPLFFLISV